MKPLLKPRKPVYVYHWGRIFIGMVTLLVTAGVVYGLLSWFASAPQEGLDRAEISPKANADMEDQIPGGEGEQIQPETEDAPGSFSHTEQETIPAQVAETADASSVSQSEMTPLIDETALVEDNHALQTEHSSLETPSPSSEVAQATGVKLTAGEAAEEEVANAIDSGESESVTDAQPSEELLTLDSEDELSEPQTEISQTMPLGHSIEHPDSVDKAPTTEAVNSPFQLKELKIIEPFVKRFLLTSSVSNREPLGELKDISFNADGSATVWVYSEVLDMLGSMLNYVWLHEGKQIARVPVKVGGDRWRSYSSKVINQSMRGAWRVELQDREGSLMASTDFYLE